MTDATEHRAAIMYRDKNGRIRRRDGYLLTCHKASWVVKGWEMPVWRWRPE